MSNFITILCCVFGLMSVTCGTEIDLERNVVEQMVNISGSVLTNLNKTLSEICKPVNELNADGMTLGSFLVHNVHKMVGLLNDFVNIVGMESKPKCREAFQHALEEPMTVDTPRYPRGESKAADLCFPSPLNIKQVIHERRKCVLHLNERPTNQTRLCLLKVMQGVVDINKQIPELSKQTDNFHRAKLGLDDYIERLKQSYKHVDEELIQVAKSLPCRNFTEEILQILQKYH